MPHSSRHLAIWTRIPATRRKICLTVQIHHRARLAPFKVLISRILRSASNLGRWGVCKNIVNIHTLLANQSGICFFLFVVVVRHTNFYPIVTKQILKQLVWFSKGVLDNLGRKTVFYISKNMFTVNSKNFLLSISHSFYLFKKFIIKWTKIELIMILKNVNKSSTSYRRDLRNQKKGGYLLQANAVQESRFST